MKSAKLFISCPMRGLSDEYIEEMRIWMLRQAYILWGDQVDELQVIDTHIPPEPFWDKRPDIMCLGRSIQKMSEADYYIGIEDYSVLGHYPGCDIENTVFLRKMIGTVPHYFIHDISSIPVFKKLDEIIREDERRRHEKFKKIATPLA